MVRTAAGEDQCLYGHFPVAKTQGGLGAVLDDKVTHSWRDMVMNAGMLGQTAVVGAARDALRKA